MNQTMLFMACGRETGNWLTTLTTSVRSFHFSPPVIYDCRKCRVKGTEFLNIMNSGWIYIWSFQSSDLGFLPTLNMMLGCWRLNSRIKNPLFEYLWFGCERLNEAFVLIGRCRNRLQFKNQTRRISFSFLFTALDCILNFVKLQIVEGPAFKRSLNATHVHGARCTAALWKKPWSIWIHERRALKEHLKSLELSVNSSVGALTSSLSVEKYFDKFLLRNTLLLRCICKIDQIVFKLL